MCSSSWADRRRRIATTTSTRATSSSMPTSPGCPRTSCQWRCATTCVRSSASALIRERRIGCRSASNTSSRVTTCRAESSAGARSAASGSCTRLARRSRHRGCASSRSGRTRSITRSRVGEVTWTSASVATLSVSRPSSPSTTRDDLVEEYSGFGLRFETRKLGTRRLGASLEWSRFDQDWRASTLDALALKPEIPPPYETRSTITPLMKFALTPELSVAAGVSISELEPLSPATELTDGKRGGRRD